MLHALAINNGQNKGVSQILLGGVFSVRGYLHPPPDLKLFVFESQMRMIFTNSGSDYDRTTRRLRILKFRFPLHFLAVSK